MSIVDAGLFSFLTRIVLNKRTAATKRQIMARPIRTGGGIKPFLISSSFHLLDFWATLALSF